MPQVCDFGRWVADKTGRWWAFFGSGTLIATVTLLMGISAFSPYAYLIGVSFYAFRFGFANAAFSAIVLDAIGQRSPFNKICFTFFNQQYCAGLYDNTRWLDAR